MISPLLHDGKSTLPGPEALSAHFGSLPLRSSQRLRCLTTVGFLLTILCTYSGVLVLLAGVFMKARCAASQASFPTWRPLVSFRVRGAHIGGACSSILLPAPAQVDLHTKLYLAFKKQRRARAPSRIAEAP